MPDFNSDDSFFISHITDAFEISHARNIPKYVGFLSEREKAIVENIKGKSPDTYCFWGGYEGAKRVFFCALPLYALPDDYSHFPISAITFRFRLCDHLSHRDFLGAILSLNIKSETVGDILVGDGIAVVFVTNAVAPLILNELCKIGRVGVKAEIGLPDVLPINEQFEEIHSTVASLRCDCVVSAVTGLSREKAAFLIESKRFSLNHFECVNVSKLLKENDVLSIRGYGRFILGECGETTKKGRIKVNIKKYI